MRTHRSISSQHSPPRPNDFGRIYTHYHKKVYEYFFYHTSRDIELAEDLTEETFTRALTHFAQFKNIGYRYGTYLMTIAHNVLVNYYRKQKSIPWSRLTADEIKNENGEGSSTELFLEYEDVHRAIEHLSTFERRLLEMRYQQGLSIADIARATGRTPTAVKLLLFRIRKKIQREYSLNHEHI